MLSVSGTSIQAGQPSPLPTNFAPAERLELPLIERQARRFVEISPLLHEILDAVPDMLLALNTCRQIIFANRSWQRFALSPDVLPQGLRPGEVLNCIHATREPGGCGTSEFCQVCGAARAILDSQAGEASEQECHITRNSGEALDLRISATPLSVGDEQFTLLAMVDISHEKRRRALERIFFHDVLNTLTALRASTFMLRHFEPEERDQVADLMTRLVERMVDEITLQRQLTDAENDELAVLPAPVDGPRMLRGLAETSSHYEMARDRTIHVASPAADMSLITDSTLLRRVLSNMLKNALEASQAGETVTLGCTSPVASPADYAGTPNMEGVEFWIHNPGCMPHEVQMQVFRRSFSTKGAGRGLGTYSIKLLTERYLQGAARFSSTPANGTTFTVWLPARLGAKFAQN